MSKKNKLYVARFVPYSQRVRSKRMLLIKTAAVTFAACIALVSATVFAAKKMPDKFYKALIKNHGYEEQTAEIPKNEETGYIYPIPDNDIRAKADRLREIYLDDWNKHHYTPLERELDNIYIYDVNKVCYLTFDDGPSDITLQVLDVLEKYKVKATFFVTGNAALANKDIIKKIYDDGHTIGNHSNTHDYGLVYGSYDKFYGEVNACREAINSALGFEYKNLVFRFPGGYTSLTDEENKKLYISALSDLGYKYTDWSCLTGDGNVTDPSAEYLTETLKNGLGNTKTGDVVVLMHDSSTKQMTADVLPSIIEYLYENGYKFDVLKNK